MVKQLVIHLAKAISKMYKLPFKWTKQIEVTVLVTRHMSIVYIFLFCKTRQVICKEVVHLLAIKKKERMTVVAFVIIGKVNEKLQWREKKR